jgi:hypothetical protein
MLGRELGNLVFGADKCDLCLNTRLQRSCGYLSPNPAGISESNGYSGRSRLLQDLIST